MSKNDTERNEAISLLEVADSNRCAICSGRSTRCEIFQQEPCRLHNTFSLAISTLRSQSEAERKIKIVIEMCNSCLESIVRYKIYTSDEMGDLARDIIETLEEKE